LLVEASILIDAPRDDVFAILTEYGGPARLRINPRLKAQTVVERDGNVFLCENEWESEGKRIVQRRRYSVFPPDRIEEEVVGAAQGLLRVTTRVEPEEDQTRLTIVSEYRFGGLWRLLAGSVVSRLRQSDEELLAVLKTGIEAEFEDVEEA
jgi:Polyketide cyclase / dehydrase and lipid transport